MNTTVRRAAIALAIVAAAQVSVAQTGTPTINQYATDAVKDLRAKVTVEQADSKILSGISRDMGLAYKIKSLVMQYKVPCMLRMEGRIGQEYAMFVVNGAERLFAVPHMHLKRHDTLGMAPGNRYSLLELGLIEKGDLEGVRSRYLRRETLNGQTTSVFELAPTATTASHYTLWIDPATHVVRKREWISASGGLRATFLYGDVVELTPGLWLPTRLEVRNGLGEVAAVTTYSGLEINKGIPDSLFKT